MPHFIINSNSVNIDEIRVSDKELYTHIAKSLRIKQGETLLFIDENEIQYITKVVEITNKEIYTKVVDSYKSKRKLSFDLKLAQSVLKPDAQFNVIQKATELGIKTIIPLITDNCAVKESIIKAKNEKWQKIALESVKQCERADIPEVMPCQKLDESFFDQGYTFIAFVERNESYTLSEYLNKVSINESKPIVAIIGPEGGFSQREFDLFTKRNIPQVSLGNLIYRADTASTVAIANLIFGINHVKS